MTQLTTSIEIKAPQDEAVRQVLTPEALQFLEGLHRTFNARRKELLDAREVRQKELDAGGKLDFLPETKEIRDGDWTVAELPNDLHKLFQIDRRSRPKVVIDIAIGLVWQTRNVRSPFIHGIAGHCAGIDILPSNSRRCSRVSPGLRDIKEIIPIRIATLISRGNALVINDRDTR